MLGLTTGLVAKRILSLGPVAGSENLHGIGLMKKYEGSVIGGCFSQETAVASTFVDEYSGGLIVTG